MTEKQKCHRAGIALMLAVFSLSALTTLPALADAAEPAAAPAAWLGAGLKFLVQLPNVLLALTAMIVALSGIRLVLAAFAVQADGSAAEGFALRWQVGGFGAPAQGWRLSVPLVRLLAGLGLVALGVALGVARMPLEDAVMPHGKEAASGIRATPTAEAPAAAAPSVAASHP